MKGRSKMAHWDRMVQTMSLVWWKQQIKTSCDVLWVDVGGSKCQNQAALLGVCLSQCMLWLRAGARGVFLRHYLPVRRQGRDKKRELEGACVRTSMSVREGDCSGFGSGTSVGDVCSWCDIWCDLNLHTHTHTHTHIHIHSDTDVHTQPSAAAVATARHWQQARAGAYSLHVAPWTVVLLQDSWTDCECRLAHLNARVSFFTPNFSGQLLSSGILLVVVNQSRRLQCLMSRSQSNWAKAYFHYGEVFHPQFLLPVRL